MIAVRPCQPAAVAALLDPPPRRLRSRARAHDPRLRLALRLGADHIEQDLQQTSDGTLVVLHDETLDRTAPGPAENCTGPVRKTLAQIETCDVGR